jgi:hypothetical protein
MIQDLTFLIGQEVNLSLTARVRVRVGNPKTIALCKPPQ